MRKTIINFGLAAGIIVIFFMFLNGTLFSRGILTLKTSEIAGYTAMLISLSMVFFGIKSYRDNHLGGTITFLKGIQIGLAISLIAGVMYFIGGEIYRLIDPTFLNEVMEQYTQQ